MAILSPRFTEILTDGCEMPSFFDSSVALNPNFSHQRTMSAIGVFIKFSWAYYDFGLQRIQMNITNQLKQINVFLTQNGFVAVLKQMFVPPVAAIIRNRIAG